MEQWPSDEELWTMYMDGKQTMEELARAAGVSRSTIKRRFKRIEKDWEQPSLSGGGFVHIDATYWGHNWGILLAIDDASSSVLYLSFIRHETVEDYRRAIASIEERGYAIRGIVFDGMQSLFKEFSRYSLQMCHFHMICIIRRYLTKNPRLRAARELKRIVFTITDTDGDAFVREFLGWKETFAATINKAHGREPLHTQEAAHGDAQRGVLPALPVHIPKGRLQGNAQHQQQNRGNLHRPKKEPEHPQRHVKGEPQAVHMWVFLGIW